MNITNLNNLSDNAESGTGTPSRMFRSADAFDFGEFPSSDGPMPSSPPGWFGVYEDPVEGLEGGEGGDGWENLGFGSSPAKGTEEGDRKVLGEVTTAVETIETT